MLFTDGVIFSKGTRSAGGNPKSGVVVGDCYDRANIRQGIFQFPRRKLHGSIGRPIREHYSGGE